MPAVDSVAAPPAEREISAMFKALGDPTRLRIFTLLRGCCCSVTVAENGEIRTSDGLTVGEVCCQVTGAEKINSTISHHLKELRLAGLVTIEQHGKYRICSVNQSALAVLAASLAEEPHEGKP